MGININKIFSAFKIYESFSVDKKKNVKEVSQVKNKKDELAISQKAKDYQIVAKGLKAMDKIPDIREEKVNEIKQKIDKGIYDVDGKDVAEKILSSIFDEKV